MSFIDLFLGVVLLLNHVIKALEFLFYSSVAATQPVIHSFFKFLLLMISSSNFIKSMGSKNTRNKKPKEMKQPLRFHELMLIGS